MSIAVSKPAVIKAGPAPIIKRAVPLSLLLPWLEISIRAPNAHAANPAEKI